MWPRALRSRANMTVRWESRRESLRASLLRIFVSALVSPPVGLGRGAELKTDQGERLSERSEFELDPVFGEHRRLPAAKRRDAATRVAFSFAYFSFGEAKEK